MKREREQRQTAEDSCAEATIPGQYLCWSCRRIFTAMHNDLHYAQRWHNGAADGEMVVCPKCHAAR